MKKALLVLLLLACVFLTACGKLPADAASGTPDWAESLAPDYLVYVEANGDNTTYNVSLDSDDAEFNRTVIEAMRLSEWQKTGEQKLSGAFTKLTFADENCWIYPKGFAVREYTFDRNGIPHTEDTFYKIPDGTYDAVARLLRRYTTDHHEKATLSEKLYAVFSHPELHISCDDFMVDKADETRTELYMEACGNIEEWQEVEQEIPSMQRETSFSFSCYSTAKVGELRFFLVENRVAVIYNGQERLYRVDNGIIKQVLAVAEGEPSKKKY